MAEIATQAEVRKFALADLEEYPGNPREISEKALAGLSGSLGHLGVLEMPVVNIRDGRRRLVGGHQRVKALRARGVTHVDCVVVDLDDAHEMAANLALNNPAIRGDFDVRKAIPTLELMLADMPTPDHLGFDQLAQELREQASRMGPEQASTASDTVAQSGSKVASKSGEVYVLGEHRLLCGSFADARKLFGKKVADACVTDPPYGVSYEQASTGAKLENDDLQGEAWLKFLAGACKTILRYSSGPCFVFMSSKEIPALYDAWRASNGVVHRWLLWVKSSFTLGRGDYQHGYEPCLLGSRAGVSFAVTTPRTNVLQFPKPQSNELHPTQKPVELIRTLIEDAVPKGGLVFDPFVGSGTTLVVCEETGRVCYACELSPVYCDVVRKRWAEQVHGAGCDWKKLTPKKD